MPLESDTDEFQPVPPSLAKSIGFLLGRSFRIYQQSAEQALSIISLMPRELGVLRIIADEGPLTQQALGKKHNIDRTTVVQMIDNLEQRELLTRVANQADRRSNLLYLTPRGKKTLAQALKLADREQQRFLAPLDESEWEALRSALIKIIQHHMQSSDYDK